VTGARVWCVQALRAEHATAQADALRERQEAEQAAADAIRESSSSSSRGRFHRGPLTRPRSFV
jgi:hypothetical protein